MEGLVAVAKCVRGLREDQEKVGPIVELSGLRAYREILAQQLPPSLGRFTVVGHDRKGLTGALEEVSSEDSLAIYFDSNEAFEITKDERSTQLVLNFIAEPLSRAGAAEANAARFRPRSELVESLISLFEPALPRDRIRLFVEKLLTEPEAVADVGVTSWRSGVWQSRMRHNLRVSSSGSFESGAIWRAIELLPQVTGWRLVLVVDRPRMKSLARRDWSEAQLDWGEEGKRRLVPLASKQLVTELRQQTASEALVQLVAGNAESIDADRIVIGWHLFPTDFFGADEGLLRIEAPLGRTIDLTRNSGGRSAVYVTAEGGRSGASFRKEVELLLDARLGPGY